jgi:hypothetical protein
LNYSFNIIENLGGFFSQATPEVKIKLLGSIFPDKIEYDGKKYRTKSYNKMLDVIFQETKHLEGRKKRKSPKIEGDFGAVPGAAAELSLITNGIRPVLCDNKRVHYQKIDILMEVFMIILE